MSNHGRPGSPDSDETEMHRHRSGAQSEPGRGDAKGETLPDDDVDETMAGGIDYPEGSIRPTRAPKGMSRENAPMEDGDDERKNPGSIQDD